MICTQSFSIIRCATESLLLFPWIIMQEYFCRLILLHISISGHLHILFLSVVHFSTFLLPSGLYHSLSHSPFSLWPIYPTHIIFRVVFQYELSTLRLFLYSVLHTHLPPCSTGGVRWGKIGHCLPLSWHRGTPKSPKRLLLCRPLVNPGDNSLLPLIGQLLEPICHWRFGLFILRPMPWVYVIASDYVLREVCIEGGGERLCVASVGV